MHLKKLVFLIILISFQQISFAADIDENLLFLDNTVVTKSVENEVITAIIDVDRL